MSRSEALSQYEAARRAGRKFYKEAVNAGRYPYPTVLDEIVREEDLAGRADLGTINVPTELIVGTKSAGRTAALAGNFMPLLEPASEFGSKWVSLCEAHLGEEGIRDPIRCYEYMGRFYVEEGNKRVSVLKSFQARTIPGSVIRLIPKRTEEHDVLLYYEFMDFYALSGQYGVTFRHRGEYARLLAALGMAADHVWTEWERRSFSAGFQYFRQAFDTVNREKLSVTPAEALLAWLKVFSFQDAKSLTASQLAKDLTSIWPDIAALDAPSFDVQTEPEKEQSRSFVSRLFSPGELEHLNIAFLYAFSPEESLWTRAHDLGRQYLEQQLGDRVAVRVYSALQKDFYEQMLQAVQDGAEVIFATTPTMIDACRKVAALHPAVRILNCALSHPYSGVRLYYSRIYECKFISGAIAGAMAGNDIVGYIANYPICGVPANINAFALGARMTNPRVRIALRWSCLPGDALQELTEAGARVISNRDSTKPRSLFHALEWGIYSILDNGCLSPLASPCWDWGKFYERVVLSIFHGTYGGAKGSPAQNYWWGLSSGVVDLQTSPTLPAGLQTLASLLKKGIAEGTVDPFRTAITDNTGVLRSDGTLSFSTEDLIRMDWLCSNVDGRIPDYEELIPSSQETVRFLALHPHRIAPETEARQL